VSADQGREYFRELGALVEDRWRDRQLDSRALPEVAAQALAALPAPARLSTWDPLRWVTAHRQLPDQVNLEKPFGEPGIQVHHGADGRFYIEVLYWLDGTTTIHQHAFSGAFCVLAGSSLHSQYAFRERERVNADLLIGELTLARAETLRAGDVRPIPSGTRLIHSLFHLDRPSVTLVVRTPTDYEAHPQYNYLHPGLAIAPAALGTALRRQMQSLQLLRDLDSPLFPEALRQVLGHWDLRSAYAVVESLLEDAFAAPDARRSQAVTLALAALGEIFGPERGRLVQEALDERRRQSYLIRRRRVITDPDLRFFLALLLNLPGQTEILRLVRERWPGEDPVTRTLALLRALSSTAQGDALNLALDDSGLDVAAELLRQGPDADLVKGLADRYEIEGDTAAQVQSMARALRGSPVLGPLFAQ
jgi:hypothetical protein